MRPTPQELVDGVRRVLRDVIEPDLSSEHARARLLEVRAVLAQMEWDESARAAGRAGEVAAVADALAWRAGDDSRREVFDDDTSLASIARALTEWTQKHPDDVSARRLRVDLMARMARPV